MRTMESYRAGLKVFKDLYQPFEINNGAYIPTWAPHTRLDPELAALKRAEAALSDTRRMGRKEAEARLVHMERNPELMQRLSTVALNKIYEQTTALSTHTEIQTMLSTPDESGVSVNDRLKRRWGQQEYKHGIAVEGYFFAPKLPSARLTSHLSVALPTERQTLVALAETGAIAVPLQLADHEGFHALVSHYGGGTVPEELDEAVGYRKEDFSFKDLPSEKLADKIIDDKENYPRIDPRKMRYATWSADRLIALGKNTAELITIIREPGEWDEQRGVWTNIHAILSDAVAKSGDMYHLERMLLKYDLERRIAKLQAKNITQLAIKEAYDTFAAEKSAVA